MPISRRVGSFTVTALLDGAGPFFSPRREAFPTATDAQWEAADRFDPGAVTAAGQWWLAFRSFAIRHESGRVTMVDAGIGPHDPTVDAWTPVPGRLSNELDAAGIRPQDVDTVVLTHLHSDHIGWAVVPDESADAGPVRRPYFSNARYVVQRADAEAFGPQRDDSLLTPLRETGQLHLVEGDRRLGDGLTAVHTPGHTPGHQCVQVESGRDGLLVTGDLLVHALQLLYPELPYRHEVDPELARRTRERALERLRAAAGTLATSHLGEAFTAAGAESA